MEVGQHEKGSRARAREDGGPCLGALAAPPAPPTTPASLAHLSLLLPRLLEGFVYAVGVHVCGHGGDLAVPAARHDLGAQRAERRELGVKVLRGWEVGRGLNGEAVGVRC